MYVAISRATKRSLINFCDTDYKLNEGFIYKITNKMTNKIYIGSTKTSIEQRYQEHLTAKDTSALHKDIQELGPENFNIELVEKIEYIDEEHY
jgi:group I intron endonuclease